MHDYRISQTYFLKRVHKFKFQKLDILERDTVFNPTKLKESEALLTLQCISLQK